MSGTRNLPKHYDDDVDIYEDLPNFQLGDTLQKLQDENKDLNGRIVQLTAELETQRSENEKLRKANHNLSCNISCLYKTASAEIVRKDAAIAELRKNLDDLLFRRKKRTGTTERNSSRPSSASVPLVEDESLLQPSSKTRDSQAESNLICTRSQTKHDDHKDRACTLEQCQKAQDKKECDGGRSWKEPEGMTVLFRKEQDQQVVDTVTIVISDEEMVECGKDYPCISEKCKKASDRKEYDGGTNPRSRKKPEEVTVQIREEPEQQVVDTIPVVRSNVKMRENGKGTSPDRLKPKEELNKYQKVPSNSEQKDEKNLQSNYEPDKLPSDRKRRYASKDDDVRTSTEFNHTGLKDKSVLHLEDTHQSKEMAAKKPKLRRLSLKSQSDSRKPSDDASSNENSENIQDQMGGNEKKLTKTVPTIAALLSPPSPPLQPPLPKEQPTPLPPPPLGTPPATPDKSAFSVVKIKEGMNENLQNNTASTSCSKTVMVNKSEADSTTDNILKPIIAATINQTSTLQCPFKSRCRVRSVELILSPCVNNLTEDSSLPRKVTDTSNSCQKKVETTSAQRNTDRLSVDFNHKKNSSKAEKQVESKSVSSRVMPSNRHPLSCKSTVQGSGWCERRSPSELLRGRRRCRVDRVSHLENSRIRSIRDRRSRSHSPQRSSSWRDRRHGYHHEHDTHQRRNRRQVTSSSSRNGTHSRQKDDGCHQQVSQPSVKSRDELKSEAKLKFRTELFGESSPEPERKSSPTFSSVSVSSTNSSIAVSAAVHAQNQLISSSKENSNLELTSSLPLKNQSALCEAKKALKTSPAVPNQPNIEGTVRVIRSRWRSNFKLEDSTDSTTKTTSKEISHTNKQVKQVDQVKQVEQVKQGTQGTQVKQVEQGTQVKQVTQVTQVKHVKHVKQVAKQECGAKSLTASRLVTTPRDFRQRYAEVFSSAGDESGSESNFSETEYSSPEAVSDESYRPPWARKRKRARRKVNMKK